MRDIVYVLMTETDPSYGEEGEGGLMWLETLLESWRKSAGQFFSGEDGFTGSIAINVSIPPWDFYVMMMDSQTEAKSWICKVLFGKNKLHRKLHTLR